MQPPFFWELELSEFPDCLILNLPEELKLEGGWCLIHNLYKMASNEASSSVVSSAPSCKYDVFLSFRGEDTRKNFTDHLYAALTQKGIVTFRDDDSLEKGNIISPELMRAIEESQFSVVVLSKNYASSSWCLEELEKIMQCMKVMGRRVLPVFYDVDPSEVRKQTGQFGEAFSKHEERFQDDLGKVQKWRDAVKEVANISGWSLKDKYESKCISEIIRTISCGLTFNQLSLPKGLVGMDSRLAELSSWLELELDDVRMIGICGMGGIGKTTIARVIYDKLASRFVGSSYIASIRENSKKLGVLYLQRQILSETLKLKYKGSSLMDSYLGAKEIAKYLCHKKVLLVLDDVDQIEQLKMLAGSCDWFGGGSRIIIISRNEHLLAVHGVSQIYKAKLLDQNEALELFLWNAFKRDNSENLESYKELSVRALKYASGLPLGVEVIGSFLFGKSLAQWKDAMDRMDKYPEEDIIGMLRISYDGLKDIEKKIFLDIACFFKSRDVDWVKEILNSCGFNPEIGIQVLVDKSLITISDNKIEMHDLIQKMGWEVVRGECPKEPGKRSRLWLYEDIHEVLMNNKGTEELEGIILHQSNAAETLSFDAEAFSKMKRLRYLQVQCVRLRNGLAYLPNELRYIKWEGFPLKSFPSSFQPFGLVELHLCRSSLEQPFQDMECLTKLKILNLSNSPNLIKTPDFETLPNLQELNLSYCTRLSEVHPSIAVHKRLVTLNLAGSKLQYLPRQLCLESLTTLNLYGCPMQGFPDILENMEKLTTLNLGGTGIRELPQTMKHLTGLEVLNLSKCLSLKTLHTCNFPSLRHLHLTYCSKLKNLPEDIVNAQRLETLCLIGTGISFPLSSLGNLQRGPEDSRNSNSVSLCGRFFRKFPFIRGSLSSTSRSYGDFRPKERYQYHGESSSSNLSYLGHLISLEELYLTGCAISSLPESISELAKLRLIDLTDCDSLLSLPKLPSSLTCVQMQNCRSLKEVPTPILDCSSMDLRLDFYNCLEMVKNPCGQSLPFTMLKSYLQSHPTQCFEEPGKHIFEITLPRKTLPKWVSHQSIGSSMEVQLPSDIHSSKVKGIVVCAVFGICIRKDNGRSSDGNQNVHLSIEDPEVDNRPPKEYINSICIKGIDCLLDIGNGIRKVSGHIGLNTTIESDHLWMSYYCLSSSEQFPSVKAVLRPQHYRLGVEVKFCGIHPIYGDDFLQVVDQFNDDVEFCPTSTAEDSPFGCCLFRKACKKSSTL